MADTIEIDLPTLKNALEGGVDLCFKRIDGCVPEIGISAEALAALLAENFSAVCGIVRPTEFFAASLASE